MCKKIEKLYKFRPLGNCKDLERIEDIIEKGFYCCDFLNFNDMNEGVFYVNKNIDITLIQKKQYKICSFSEEKALKRQLMWGHYANAGMGIAIEICVNEADVKKVFYKKSKPPADWENRDCIEKILTSKSADWKDEHEYRYINQGGNSKIFKGKITGICFGTPYKKLGNYEDIKENHTKLKKYLRLKECLEKFCEENNPEIKFGDCDFTNGNCDLKNEMNEKKQYDRK